MKYFRPLLLASAAIGLASVGSAFAMPLTAVPAQADAHAQNVRIVCDQWGRCYNTRNRYRGGHYYRNDGYRGYDNGYYRSNRGPFGLF